MCYYFKYACHLETLQTYLPTSIWHEKSQEVHPRFNVLELGLDNNLPGKISVKFRTRESRSDKEHISLFMNKLLLLRACRTTHVDLLSHSYEFVSLPKCTFSRY